MHGWRRIVAESALLLALLAAAPVFVPTSARQAWDFETYWYAARAALTGGNPYSSDQLAHVADRPVAMPFVYPPATIPIFAPFTLPPILDARWIWLGLKVVAFLAMFQIWRRRIVPSVSLVPLAFAAAFGFNAASIWDLKTGNVSGFEQLGLWLGLAAYLRSELGAAACRIAAGSIFKLLPAAFLVLLALPHRARRSTWKVPALAAGALVAIVFLPVAFGPQWAHGYLGNIPDERPWGYVNPSALGLIDTLTGTHGGSLFSESRTNLILWLGYAALVSLLSVRPVIRAWRARDPGLWVMTATPLFVLLLPRPMIYTYVLAIPAMFGLTSSRFRKLGGDYAVAGLLGAQAFAMPGLGLNYENPWTSNLPFFLLFGLWSLYAVRAPVSEEAATPARWPAKSTSPVEERRPERPPGRPWPVLGVVLAALAGAGWFLFAEIKVAGRLGYSLDDSWIYATFARNLATGHGYSFNPGEPIGGATGPLYVAILAALFFLFRDVVLPAKVLGVACLVGSSVLVYRTVQTLDPRDRIKPVVAGLLTALSPSLLWGSLSGMEIPVYLFLTCIGLNAYVARKWTLATLAWSLGVWARPDGIFLALIGLIARPRDSLRRIAPIAVFALVLAAYFGFNQMVGGSSLPSSVGVKANPGTSALTLLGAVRHWAGLWGMPFGPNRIGEHAIILLPAIVVGAVCTFRRLPALSLYVFGIPLAFALAGVPWSAHGRYIMYVVPFGLVLGAVGLDYLSRRGFRRSRATAILVAGALCLSWQVYQVRLKGVVHGWNVQNIENMHRFFAERVATVASPGDTIAVNDVGAMGYFSGCYVVDLVGLVSPRRPFPENLSHYHPKYLALFPDWYAAHGARDPSIDNIVFYPSDSTYKYTPVAGVGLTRKTIASRDQMILFERIGPRDTGPAEVPVYWR